MRQSKQYPIYSISYYTGIQTMRLLRRLGRVLSALLHPLLFFLRRTVGHAFKSFFTRFGEWGRALAKEFAQIGSLLRKSPLKGIAYILLFPFVLFRRYRNASRLFLRVCAVVVAVFVLMFTLEYWNGITYAVALNVDGDIWGYVSDESVLQNGAAMAYARVRNSDDPAVLEVEPKMSLSMVHQNDIMDEKQVCDLLLEKSDLSLVRACGLYVDGVLQGALLEEEEAQKMLDTILTESCDGQKGVTASFFQTVELVKGLYPSSAVFENETMKYMLTSEATNKEFYTVEEGDTYASISAKVGVTAWDVMRLNPKAGSVLTEGQTLLVRDSDPHLQVLVTGTIEYEVEIPYTVQRVEDASKYKGYEKTRVKGENGIDRITAAVTYLDGKELFSSIVSSATVKPPVTQVVAYGTKVQKTKTYKGGPHAQGNFIWPVPYTKHISQYYGNNGHGGMDIAAHGIQGQNILAADGGVVVISAYRKGTTYGSYGKYIVIDHGGGYQSLYAHCDELLVEVGDIVKQGQVIAKVGNTGRSTGPHLHLEITVNGRRTNPLSYF